MIIVFLISIACRPWRGSINTTTLRYKDGIGMKNFVKQIGRGKRKTIFFTIAVILFYVFYLLWVIGNNYAGNINWLPVGSNVFGIPKKIQELFNVDLLIKNGASGWDGQFYYYISNDLFGTKGYSQFVDAPGYRWQRIGLPLVAKVISLFHFGKAVSVYDYLIANLLILAIGIYVLSEFYREKNRSLFWILPWCLSAGVLITLKCLLPDSAADAFVIIAMVMLLKRRYPAYVLAMTFACLTREGYAAIAFLVFVAGFLGFLEEKKYSVKFAALLAIPGIVFALWYLYITVKFGMLPYKVATHADITKFFLSDWPVEFMSSIARSDYIEFLGLIFYLFTILLSIVLVYVVGKKDNRYFVFSLYVFIVASFGHTVMMDWSGYLKGISFLLALIPVLFLELDVMKKKNCDATNFLQICMMGYLVFGLLLAAYFVPKHLSDMAGAYYLREEKSNPVDYSNSNPLYAFDGEITISNIEEKPFASNSILAAITPEYAVYTLNVKNNTDQLWSKKQLEGMYSINMGYKWFTEENETDPILEGRTNLVNNIAPFADAQEKLFVKYPTKKGRYVLKVTLVQEGVAWFSDCGGAQTTLLIDVK